MLGTIVYRKQNTEYYVLLCTSFIGDSALSLTICLNVTGRSLTDAKIVQNCMIYSTIDKMEAGYMDVCVCIPLVF